MTKLIEDSYLHVYKISRNPQNKFTSIPCNAESSLHGIGRPMKNFSVSNNSRDSRKVTEELDGRFSAYISEIYDKPKYLEIENVPSKKIIDEYI